MRGDQIGALSIGNAYKPLGDAHVQQQFKPGMFSTLKSYFAAGNRVLIIYVPRTRGTYSGGYCYDYLSIVAATLTLTYTQLQSDASLSSTSVAAGSAAKLNIVSYNAAYTHKVVWRFGSYSYTQTVAAGLASASTPSP